MRDAIPFLQTRNIHRFPPWLTLRQGLLTFDSTEMGGNSFEIGDSQVRGFPIQPAKRSNKHGTTCNSRISPGDLGTVSAWRERRRRGGQEQPRVHGSRLAAPAKRRLLVGHSQCISGNGIQSTGFSKDRRNVGFLILFTRSCAGRSNSDAR